MPRKKAATQPGVAETDESVQTASKKPVFDKKLSDEVIERVKQAPTARDLQMQQIVQGRKRELEAEIGDPLPEEAAVPAEPEVTLEDKPATKLEAPKGPMVKIQLDDGSVMEVPKSAIRSTLKIDGAEQEMNLQDIERGYQKDAAGSKKLEEAAALKRKAEELMAQLQNPSRASADPVTPAPSSEDVQKAAEQIVQSLFEGEREDAVKAVATLLKPKPVMLNEDELAAKIERRLDGKAAGQWFKDTYKDIVEDERLFGMADRRADELLRENPTLSYRDVFKKAGDEVMEWLDSYRPKAQPEVTEKAPVRLQDREERKRETVESLPMAAGAIASIGQDAPRAKTPSETIQEMRKARGQIF